MVGIRYVEHDGTNHSVEVQAGISVMEAAVRNNVTGIVAECGGACACATCHIYVAEAWMDAVGQPSEMEASMLEFALDVQPNSRLSCQIKISEALDGMVVTIPENQG
jgi:2Fe-2S ferredoxin